MFHIKLHKFLGYKLQFYQIIKMLKYLSFYNKIKSFDVKYHSPLIHRVKNLLKSTDINIAFRTCNFIYKQLCDRAPQNKIKSSGLYKVQCKT